MVTYNGRTWSETAQIPRVGLNDGASCPSTTFCVVTASYTGAISTFDGTTWTSVKVDQAVDSRAVSCSSKVHCVALNNNLAESFTGSGWSAPAIIDAHSGLSAVSCPTARFCVAVDKHGNAVVYKASEWASPRKIDHVAGFVSVSCSAPTFCAAVDQKGGALIYDGTGWSTRSLVADQLTSVSCVSRTLCMATGDSADGNVFEFNGTQWTASAHVGGQPLLHVSCSSANFCAVTDWLNKAATFNGTAWSKPQRILSGRHEKLVSLSCTSRAFCMALGTFGAVLTYDGASWSAAGAVPANSKVSCSSGTFCMAISREGLADAYSKLGSGTATVSAPATAPATA